MVEVDTLVPSSGLGVYFSSLSLPGFWVLVMIALNMHQDYYSYCYYYCYLMQNPTKYG